MFGPIVDREMMTLPRRRSCFGGRVVVPLVMLLIMWGNLLGWRYYNGGPATVQQVALFGRLTFAQLMVAQIMLTMYLVTDLVSRSVAEEKDRKTLTFVLSTPLSSFSIVLGKLAAGLGQFLSCLSAGLPVFLLLPLFGGVEPELALVCYAATLSIGLFLASLALAISVVSRQSREAHRITTGMIPVWLFGPVVVQFFLSRLVPWFYVVIRPINELVLASSPISLALTSPGFLYRGPLMKMAFQMIGLQLIGASLLVALATLALRPAWRRHDDSGAGRLEKIAGRRRPGRRPECGDRPILWKELHATRARGVPWLVYRVLFVVLAAILVISTYYAGREAFAEVFANGYGWTSGAPGRAFFNGYLRGMSTAISAVYVLTVVGLASEGIVVERIKETWLGLIATPLPGREIVRDKMIGALWRTRGLAALIAALWIAGLAGGAIHPIGVLAALVCLAVWSWFAAALGTYGSLRAKTIASASNASILPVLLLGLCGLLPITVTPSMRSVLYGVGSLPFLQFMALLSYPEIHELDSLPGSSPLSALRAATGEGSAWLLLTYALGVIGAAGGAIAISELAYRQFDRLVGRPVRGTSEVPLQSSGDPSRPEPALEAVAAGT